MIIRFVEEPQPLQDPHLDDAGERHVITQRRRVAHAEITTAVVIKRKNHLAKMIKMTISMSQGELRSRLFGTK